MKTYFDHKQYIGEYNEMTGALTVTNAYTGEIYIKSYSSKYTAKRGFERIVRMLRA